MTLEKLTLSDEEVQDIVASLITGGGGSDVVYDDTNDTLTVSLSDSISVNTLEATDASIDTLDAVDATVANRDIPNTLYRHELGLGEARFNLGLEQLQFKSGFFDTLQDESNVASKTDVEGFNGSVTTVSAVDVGSFRSAYDTLGFTPTSAVIGHTADQLADVTATDGDSFNYPTSNVSDPTLSLTGRIATNSTSDSFTGQADGDTQSVEVGGNVETDVDVTLTGASKAGRHIDTYDTVKNADGLYQSVFDVISEDNLIFGYRRSKDDVWAYNYETQTEKWTIGESAIVNVIKVSADAGNVYIGNLNGYSIHSIADEGNVNSFFDGNVKWMAVDEPNNILYAAGADNVRITDLNGNGQTEYNITRVDGVTADTKRGHALFTTDDSTSLQVEDSNFNNQYYISTDTDVNEEDRQQVAYDETSDNWLLFHIHENGGARITAYNADDGSENWEVKSSDIGTGDINSPIDAGGGYAVTTYYDGSTTNILYLDANDGSVINNVQPSPSGGETGGIVVLPDSQEVWIKDSDNKSRFYRQSTNSSTEGVTYNLDGSSVNADSIAGGSSVTKTVPNVNSGSYTTDVSIDTGLVDIDLFYTKKTETVDPSITIDSDAGNQIIDYAGTLSDGETVDLSNEIDPSLIDGNVTVSVGVSETVDSPAGTVGLEYAHSDFDAGGLVKYRIEDDSGNSVVVTEDELVDLAFNSDNVRVEPVLQDGLGSVELFDYAVYFNGGTQ